ncbi:MAG: sensor histidine kinase [Proteobacteria bacterium]|nr:sensor histidine kinase [Pseudomonadota bacterium]
MKISTKLYAGFLLVLALTAALGFHISSMNSKSLLENVGREAVFEAEGIMKRIDQSIHDKIMEVGAATRRNWVISIVAASNTRFEQLENIEDYLAEMESQWTGASSDMANTVQQELMSNDLANELRDEFITFHETKDGNRSLANILITNRYGASIAQTDQIDHFRHDTETWWQESKQQEMYIEELGGMNKISHTQGIPVSFRIVDDTNNFFGMLKTEIDIKAKIRSVELATKHYKTSQITLLTSDGRVIYRTRPYRFMEDFSSWKYFNRLQGKDNSFAGISQGNKEKLYSFSRSKGYKHYPGSGWILMVENDLDEVMAPARSLRNKIVITTLILILLGLLLAFFISQTIIRSLSKLREGVERIGKGDLAHKIELDTTDEVGQLAHSFNEMTRNLKNITASRDELETEIAQRKQVEKERTKLTAEITRKNMELEQIVYVTSHDLRSPLVNVQGFSKELENAIKELVDVYEDGEISGEEAKKKVAPLLLEDIPESLKYIQKSIDKMDALLAGLLGLSRLGRAILDIEDCDMDRLMKDVLASVEYQINASGVIVDLSPLPPCRGDADQLNQVFSNIIDNALKYFDPDRPGRISLSGQIKNGRAVYCVTDNGIGIAAEHQNKIFELFHRLNPAASSGEGLGLNIISRILERQDGKVWLESEPGKGSSFYVELPGQEIG